MCRKNIHTLLLCNNRGFGLIAAVFVIVIMAMFGTLLVFYISTGKITSAEDYLWAQSLYSAESAAGLKLLYNDGGGTGAYPDPEVAGFTTTATDLLAPATDNTPEVIRGTATKSGLNISRTVELKYIL